MLQQNLSLLAFRQFYRILISSFIELRSNRPLQLFIESGVQCVEKPAVAESEVLEPIVVQEPYWEWLTERFTSVWMA